MTEVNVYIGKDYDEKYKKRKNSKVIAFDLDETLGSFADLYVLWQAITQFYENENIEIKPHLFRKVLDTYPEFLRHGILKILAYLYTKKLSGECSKVFLYTNNQCYGTENSIWLSHIIDYIHFKICHKNENLFDKIICAFKINNQIIEPLRTTHNKTYSDFIRCSLIPKNAELCFIDNTYYNKMVHNRVYYIQPKSYLHSLSKNEIMRRAIHHLSIDAHFLYEWFSKFPVGSQTRHPLQLDMLVSQKIMYHLKEFFLLSTKGKKTKKLLVRFGKFTRKTRT